MNIPDPSPATLVKLHLAGMILWALLIIPTLLWWRTSLLWIAFMSIYAAWVGHFSGWDAARAELATQEDAPSPPVPMAATPDPPVPPQPGVSTMYLREQ